MRYKYPAVTDVQHLQVRVLTRVASAVPNARRRRPPVALAGTGDRDRQYGVESDAFEHVAPPLFERPGGRSGDPDA